MSRDEGPLPDFLEEAQRVVAAAEKAGIVFRLMGAAAIRLHSAKQADLYRALRRELSDLDFAAYSKDLKGVGELLKRLGYTSRRGGYGLAVSSHGERYFFDDTINNRIVDIFFDQLKMCHTISFRNRLEIDSLTIPLADILLEKMQIVKLNEKDVKDTIVLFRGHEVGAAEKETINMTYIAKLLSDDWGFYYTVTTNLRKVQGLLRNYSVLSDLDVTDVTTKVEKLMNSIDSEPKSFRWKARAKIGTRMKWYEEVEETVRTYS